MITHQDLPTQSLLPKLRGVPRNVIFAAIGEQGAPNADEVTRGLHHVAESISLPPRDGERERERESPGSPVRVMT